MSVLAVAGFELRSNPSTAPLTRKQMVLSQYVPYARRQQLGLLWILVVKVRHPALYTRRVNLSCHTGSEARRYNFNGDVNGKGNAAQAASPVQPLEADL